MLRSSGVALPSAFGPAFRAATAPLMRWLPRCLPSPNAKEETLGYGETMEMPTEAPLMG